MWFFLLLLIRLIGTEVRPRILFAKRLDLVAGKNDYISLGSSRQNHILTKLEQKKKKLQIDLYIYHYLSLCFASSSYVV